MLQQTSTDFVVANLGKKATIMKLDMFECVFMWLSIFYTSPFQLQSFAMGRYFKWNILLKLELQGRGDGMKPFSMEKIQWNLFQSDKDAVIELRATIPLHRFETFIVG